MNLNKWADSWGAGCVFASVASVLFEQWYSVRRHQERNMDMYIPSIKASLLHRRAFMVAISVISMIGLYQFLSIILWPTAFKQSRYYCGQFNNSELCPGPLIVLILEFLFECLAISLLFCPSYINTVPLKLDNIPITTYIGNDEYHPMTSSSKLKIHNAMTQSERALFACFLLKGITEMFLYSSDVVIDTGLVWARGVGFIFLLMAQYLSNRIIYLMSKKSVNWRMYKSVTKKSTTQIENFVNHLKFLIILSLIFLVLLVIFDMTYVIMFSMNVVKGMGDEGGNCVSDKLAFTATGCKSLIIVGLVTAMLRFLATIFTIFLYVRSLVVVGNEIDYPLETSASVKYGYSTNSAQKPEVEHSHSSDELNT